MMAHRVVDGFSSEILPILVTGLVQVKDVSLLLLLEGGLGRFGLVTVASGNVETIHFKTEEFVQPSVLCGSEI